MISVKPQTGPPEPSPHNKVTSDLNESKSIAHGAPVVTLTPNSVSASSTAAASTATVVEKAPAEPELSALEQLLIKVKEKALTDPKMAPLLEKVAKQVQAERALKLAAKIKEQEVKRVAEVAKRQADIVKLSQAAVKVDSMQFPGMPGPPPFKPKIDPVATPASGVATAPAIEPAVSK